MLGGSGARPPEGASKMAKRLVSTGGFVAADASGGHHWLEVLTEFEDVVRPGYFRSVAGKRSIRTSLGHRVDAIGKSTYRIAETGVVVTSNDPLAP